MAEAESDCRICGCPAHPRMTCAEAEAAFRPAAREATPPALGVTFPEDFDKFIPIALPAPSAGEKRYTQAELNEACQIAAERGAQNEREGRLPEPAGEAAREAIPPLHERLTTGSDGHWVPAPPAGEPDMAVKCSHCGAVWGEHIGPKCPDGEGTFQSQPAREEAAREATPPVAEVERFRVEEGENHWFVTSVKGNEHICWCWTDRDAQRITDALNVQASAPHAPPAGETHLHGNTYCYEGDECVICREQKRQATSDSPEAATRYGSDSFQPSAPNGGGSGQYLTPAQAVVIMVRDEMKHAENYVCPDSGVVRFCIPLAHLNILLKAVEGE